MEFPGGSVVNKLAISEGDTGDTGSIPPLGRSPGGGNSNLLHYSCLGNPMGHKELDLTEYTCNQVLFDIHNLDVAQASQA